MGTQSKTLQGKILSAARRDNYAGLYWIVECEYAHQKFAPAVHHRRWIPAIPVAPDPEITRHWAHILVEMFALHNPPPVHFETVIVVQEELSKFHWYELGDILPIDLVCLICGATSTVDHFSPLVDSPWQCDECWQRFGAKI